MTGRHLTRGISPCTFRWREIKNCLGKFICGKVVLRTNSNTSVNIFVKALTALFLLALLFYFRFRLLVFKILLISLMQILNFLSQCESDLASICLTKQDLQNNLFENCFAVMTFLIVGKV